MMVCVETRQGMCCTLASKYSLRKFHTITFVVAASSTPFIPIRHLPAFSSTKSLAIILNIRRRLAFSVDPVTCRVFRDNAVIIKDMPIFEPYLKEMAPDPAVLHGLGGRPSKNLYKELSEKVFRCRKKHLQLGVILQ
jgi:hypothetical protein